jgi:hypothetical protein
MTITIDGTAGITFPNGTNPQDAPCKVLQVVNATYSSEISTTGSGVSTGFSTSITPLFATSKILLIARIPVRHYGNSQNYGTTIWYRNGTPIQPPSAGYETGSLGTPDTRLVVSQVILDTPATTSSVTYALYATANSGQTFYVFPNSFTGSVVLMEIAQ